MALWHDGDDQTEKRRNRESAPLRLVHPAFDIIQGGTVTVTPTPIDGDDVVTGETTHFTAGASAAFVVVHSLTLCNSSGSTRQVSLHLVPSAGSRTAANAIFDDNVTAGETVTLEGPWFLSASQTIRSISADASAGDVALTGAVSVYASVVPGVTHTVDNGDALTTGMVAYYTAPASLVQQVAVVAITACNTDSSARTVTVELRPNGGSTTSRQYLFSGAVSAGETVILGSVTQPYLLDPGDAIYALASTGSVVGFRVTPVEYATS